MGVITLQNIFFRFAVVVVVVVVVFFFICTPCNTIFYLLCFVSFTVSKVDLTRRMKIRKVSMQGAKDGKGFIKSYTISTRDDANLSWRPFSQDNKIKVNLLKEAANLFSRRGF